MKSWVFGVLAFVTTFSSGVALGCPVGIDDDGLPRRPIVQPVNVQVSQLFERAAQLETAASNRELQASTLDRRADVLANRARILRQQAIQAPPSERGDILAAAEELASRALSDRQLAARERASASELRLQARNLRDRANQLVLLGNGNNNGNGWRKRRPLAAGDTTI